MSVAAFDTAVLVDALKGLPEAGAELQRYRQRFISRLTWITVMSHAQPDDTHRAEGFLSHFSVVEVSDEIARSAAQLCGQRAGLSLDNAVILASAQVSGRILITRNTKDFPAAMPGIRVPYTL
jgi:predicted nucleic acid-binding protein